MQTLEGAELDTLRRRLAAIQTELEWAERFGLDTRPIQAEIDANKKRARELLKELGISPS